jgi:hypothetical protein
VYQSAASRAVPATRPGKLTRSSVRSPGARLEPAARSHRRAGRSRRSRCWTRGPAPGWRSGARAVILRVVEVAPADDDRVRHRHHGRGRDQSGLQRRRERHDLKDRARLVVLGEGQVVDGLFDAGLADRLPQTGIGPSTPGWVLVFTSDASARISPVFTSITTATPVEPARRRELAREVAFGRRTAARCPASVPDRRRAWPFGRRAEANSAGSRPTTTRTRA